MIYVSRPASPPLDALVERLFCCDDATPRSTRAGERRERILPGGGTVDLGISLIDDELQLHDRGPVRVRSGAIIAGARTRSYFVDARVRSAAVGVHFKPGGAFVFLGISAAEIVDAHVALHDLWGADGRDLQERVLEARSAEDRLRIVEVALLRRLRRARDAHPAVRAAIDAFRVGPPGTRVADVAASVGLGRRRLADVFEREVGVTPKVYARLRRFHRVKHRLATRGQPSSWAAFALAAGYYDQAHMIRDFVEFAGISPTGYLRARDGETNFDHAVHAHPSNQPVG